MRLRITYRSGLRNLQETTAESARTDCTITDENLLKKNLSAEEGANVNYNCTANATGRDASTANFTLNTDIPITMVNSNGTIESLDFSEVNFIGDSAESSSSLQDNQEVIGGVATLKVTSADIDKYNLILKGNLDESRRRLRNLALSSGDKIIMNFLDNSNVTNKYECTLTKSTISQLDCDTSSNPIKTTVGKLDLSAGTSEDNSTLFTVELDNSIDRDSPLATQGSNRYTYNKSSSGLSGGAIAGIVIACVVALAAASIAAIMLRKPSPLVENTTIVELKNENI